MVMYAAKRRNAKNLLREAVVAMSLGGEWIIETPHKEGLAMWRESRDMRLPAVMVQNAIKAVPTDDLVGADEE